MRQIRILQNDEDSVAEIMSDLKLVPATVYSTTFPIDETIHPIHPSFEADRAS